MLTFVSVMRAIDGVWSSGMDVSIGILLSP